MGTNTVASVNDSNTRKEFIAQLLRDIKTLELMLKKGVFEDDVCRIGVEQEMCLADTSWRPATNAMALLKEIDDPHFTTELATFNMEANLDPQEFKGKAIRKVHDQLLELLEKAYQVAEKHDTHIMLTGILPTIRKSDIDVHNITPIARYKELLDRMYSLRGKNFEFRIKGVDELIANTNTVLFEACNTSIQAHYQVNTKKIIEKYNWSQMIAGPVLAACTNSPLLLGKRLWRETRIALFQQIVELTGRSSDIREFYSRAVFGQDWVHGSILNLIKSDVARYEFLLSDPEHEDSLSLFEAGKTPKLRAYNLFNGTVYKWNRACYGTTNGKPHLRIECRYLPSGPTVEDEMANMTFWWGLMHCPMEDSGFDIEKIAFDDAKRNFFRAAHLGLNTQFRWIDGSLQPANELIFELLRLAKIGLDHADIRPEDADYYLGIIRDRVSSTQTGSKWMLDSVESLAQQTRKEDAMVALTAAMYKRQKENQPVHTWKKAELKEAGDWKSRFTLVRQLMSADLCTVNEDDPIDYAAHLMDWLGIHHLPVENTNKELVGLVTAGKLLHYYNEPDEIKKTMSLKDIMVSNVVTVGPNHGIKEAVELMRAHKVGSLPVVSDKKLVGILTEHDLIRVLGFLL